MSLVRRHTIDVLRAPLVDDGRGNEDRDWSKAVEHESKGWSIDVGNTAEDTTNRDGDSIEYTLRGPIDADLLASDRVRLMGGLFLVSGAVGRQPGASALTSHSVVKLKSWEG